MEDASTIGPRKSGILAKLFSSCAPDPRGSVHRAWGISLLFVVLYFVLAVIEMLKLHQNDGSIALIIAAVWTGIVHLGLGVLGTFVLKRFPTSFSVGFLLGVLVVLANQNLILFSTFSSYGQGSAQTNHVFASLGFTLFAVLAFMALLLLHFKQDVVVTPMDGKDEEETGEAPTPVA